MAKRGSEDMGQSSRKCARQDDYSIEQPGPRSSPGNCPSQALSAAVDGMLLKPGTYIPNMDDIALDPDVRDLVLSTICMPLQLPEASRPFKVLGILLHGLPGCGKSLIMKAATKQYDLTVFDVDISAIFSKRQGDSEKFISHLFERAIKLQPSVIFIDHIDSVMSVRTSSDSASVNHVKSIILKLWQDLHDDGHQVVLVGATHIPEMIDPVFLRLFDHRIHVKLPSLEAKAKILKLHLCDEHHTLKREDIHDLVHDKNLMRDVSGDDIEKAISAARAKLALVVVSCGTWEKVTQGGKEIIIPAIRTIGDDLIRCSWKDFNGDDRRLLRPRPITKEHLIKAFKNRKPSFRARDFNKQLDWADAHGTCS